MTLTASFSPDLFGTTERQAAIDALHERTAIYTVDAVVERLLDLVRWPEEGGCMVDTSCGDGAFVVAALRRLLDCEPQATPERVLDRLEAWEIHYQACAQARSRLAEVLREAGWEAGVARSTAERLVHEADFLTEWKPTKPYTAIVGNPPYLRFANVPSPLREEYEQALPVYATADMLHSFLDRCADRLAPGGEIALVTSDRWLNGDNAGALREAIGQRLGVALLDRLDATSSFYRPKDRRAGTPARVHPVAVVLREKDLCATPLGRKPIYPGQIEADWATTTLDAVASVRLAPWLGNPGVFVVDALTARRLPPEVLVPAVDSDDMRTGVIGQPTRYAIRTSPDVEPCDEVKAHLQANAHLMAKRGRSALAKWLPPERFDHLDLSQEALVVPRIARSLRVMRLEPGVLVINHNHTIVRRGSATLDEIERALLDPRVADWVAGRADGLENNFLSIKTGLMRSVPLAL